MKCAVALLRQSAEQAAGRVSNQFGQEGRPAPSNAPAALVFEVLEQARSALECSGFADVRAYEVQSSQDMQE